MFNKVFKVQGGTRVKEFAGSLRETGEEPRIFNDSLVKPGAQVVWHPFRQAFFVIQRFSDDKIMVTHISKLGRAQADGLKKQMGISAKQREEDIRQIHGQPGADAHVWSPFVTGLTPPGR